MRRSVSLLCGLLLAGCSMTSIKPEPRPVDAAAIYGRAGIRFESTLLFKPAESANPDLLFTLAPLILLQVANTNEPPQIEDRILGRDAIADRPVVYGWADAVSIRGRPHPRLNYAWNHSPPANTITGANVRQGVRITLASNGQPMIWEVLGDTSGHDLIVVSESLEQSAAAEFGPPLPGRQYSVENSTNTAPRTLVMRVIDDGPVVMGPIIYLSHGTHDVATIICRCMPAQATNVTVSSDYELLSHPAANAVWPDIPLEKRLRLPEF